ncbi:nicotinamide riboside transporter PnuC [Sphingomonas sp.]|uniref:nicotinamide riboside transporter PnuC n=1 Tax=Sphingomonas sp. TaxID=28214 RepID=UPI001B08D4AD|nr:nicotinamide riboside transporter PnuC [Sphingomonas sp.]MBO9713829.1 nicotinamide mononucleotide transporter [Sphingomonas sp.]
MSPLELAAVLLGLVNVALVVRRSIWNYPFGIVMVALYAWIFAEAKLYSDALLQLFFLVVQFYGWWNWLRSRAESGEVVVLTLGWGGRTGWAGGCIAATLGWGWLMQAYTDAAYPFWDASVAMMSIAAQILMSRRYLENWWLWILVDLDAIPLYAAKDLWLTAWLYFIFLALSVWGLVEWFNVRNRAAG